MRLKAVVFAVIVAFLISALGLIFFVFDGGDGGRGYGVGGQSARSLWLVLFVVPLFFAFSILGYFMVFPDLRLEKPKKTGTSFSKGKSIVDAVLLVLDDDEKKIVETLVAEGGTMLQKDIRWKTGFSRVKTHRVLFRLTKRGVVSAEKYYNTNKITLANWLIKEKKQP